MKNTPLILLKEAALFADVVAPAAPELVAVPPLPPEPDPVAGVPADEDAELTCPPETGVPPLLLSLAASYGYTFV